MSLGKDSEGKNDYVDRDPPGEGVVPATDWASQPWNLHREDEPPWLARETLELTEDLWAHTQAVP